MGNDFSGLVRICLFKDLLGLSDRPANSDGNPVEGWLIHHRRPEPLAKSTADKDLYGALSELEVEKEDWVIIDPKDNDIRETATSNLIFCSGNELLIPEKFILQGVVLRQLLPLLQQNFSVTRGAPLKTAIFPPSMKSYFVEVVAGLLLSMLYPNWDGILREMKTSIRFANYTIL